MTPQIRTSAKAVIVQPGRILLIRNSDASGDWYCLPGGGQAFGEALHDTLRRECLEEIGCDVNIGRLLFVRDYISRNHEFAASEPECHQVELMFECALQGDRAPTMGGDPDHWQRGVSWLALDLLTGYRIYPGALVPYLIESPESYPVYLGDVN